MLISFSQKLIFIHVQRTAGGSIINALREYEHRPPATRWNKILTRTRLQRDPHKLSFRVHETALQVRQLLPKGMYENYLSAGFVRNPYSWLVSVYEIARQESQHRHHPIVSKMGGFAEYVDWEMKRNKRFQYPLLTDRDGRVMVDFIGHFERLRDDFDQLCDRLQLPLIESLPHTHKRTPSDYRDYYDDETRNKVASHWHKDIDLFGYDFEALVVPGQSS